MAVACACFVHVLVGQSGGLLQTSYSGAVTQVQTPDRQPVWNAAAASRRRQRPGSLKREDFQSGFLAVRPAASPQEGRPQRRLLLPAEEPHSLCSVGQAVVIFERCRCAECCPPLHIDFSEACLSPVSTLVTDLLTWRVRGLRYRCTQKPCEQEVWGK
ncbi:hypothetical protein DPEC_G00059570 [Dallia pectoralis]|uniref:Uncharacterized protein n=1 Tax=Dallia pectoralis TaxID=75939 RepID=A0ACC2H6Q0_DALPE|nr:hypothetical protein DPEC_G00059570 [Dallia pectoralis]